MKAKPSKEKRKKRNQKKKQTNKQTNKQKSKRNKTKPVLLIRNAKVVKEQSRVFT